MNENEAHVVRYECAGASARGCVHRENQDRFRISDTGVVLCDGVGGGDAGEVFAEASCWSCDRLLGAGLDADEILDYASEQISGVGRAIDGHGGSSACIIQFHQEGSIDIASRGDVLAFRTDGHHIAVINHPDYTPSWDLESYLGDGLSVSRKNQHYCVTPLEAGRECLILVSDGVWQYASADDMMTAWLNSNGNMEEAAKRLVSLAGRYGSLDDRTAVFCRRL